MGPILRTKLTPPNSQRVLVARKHLDERISRIRDARLSLVSAPAGYGKTSFQYFLFNKLGNEGYAPGWFSIDQDDNDLTQFLNYFLAAIHPRDERVGRATEALLSTGFNMPNKVLRDTFLNDLVAVERDTYLFIDDFHLITDPSIVDLVGAILRAPLDKLHMVVSSRHQRNLPLGWLRVQGQLELVSVDDLGFSDDEAIEFFKGVGDEKISEAEVQLLCNKTEGWAAGLQLAAIALRGTANKEQFMRSFSGETCSVSDFLADEVVKHQPRDIQNFLMGTSILGRFNWSLCNTVLEIDNSKTLIERLADLNLFIFSLDDERNWYRYHHLFADLLRKRFREENPSFILQYHLRASRWFEDNGHPVEAIEHAFLGHFIDRAATLLEANSSRLFAAGKTATLVGYSDRLPPSVVDQLPMLMLDCAWFNELSWRFDEARALLERVRTQLVRRCAEDDGSHCAATKLIAAKLAHREMMLDVLTDDLFNAKEKASIWLESGQSMDHFMCASAGTAIMLGRREQYLCEGVGAQGRMLSEQFFQGGALYGIVFHECVVGGTFLLRGELSRAEEAYLRARNTAEELHGKFSELYALPAIVLTEVLYEQDRIDEAESAIRDNDITADLGFVDKLIAGFVTRSKIAANGGKEAEAMAGLEEATYLADKWKFDRLHANVLNELVRQMVQRGQVKDAASLLKHPRYAKYAIGKLGPREDTSTKHELFADAIARVWMETDRAADAVALLKQWYSFIQARKCNRAAIRVGLLLTKANARMGNRLAANRIMGEILRQGEQGGFLRAFVDEGSLVMEMILDLYQSNASEMPVSKEYLTKVLRAGAVKIDSNIQMDRDEIASELGGEASEREIQIIRLGARGFQNGDIAKSLFLAESTVKWYWQKIFEKLDVRRRSDAIKRARTLRWIE